MRKPLSSVAVRDTVLRRLSGIAEPMQLLVDALNASFAALGVRLGNWSGKLTIFSRGDRSGRVLTFARYQPAQETTEE
jgi:hypothetical protein